MSKDDRLGAIRNTVASHDWPILAYLVPKTKSRKVFGKYESSDAFHKAFMTNDKLAERTIKLLDSYFSIFVNAADECDEEAIKNCINIKGTDVYESLLKTLDPVLSLINSSKDLYGFRWAMLSRFPILLGNAVGCFNIAALYGITCNRVLTKTNRAISDECDSLKRQVSKLETTVESLQSKLATHDITIDEAVKAAYSKKDEEIAALNAKLKEKDSKILELERGLTNTTIISDAAINNMRLLTNDIDEYVQLGKAALSDEEIEEVEDNIQHADIINDLRSYSKGLRLLVIGGARPQARHKDKFKNLCDELGMYGEWYLAEYDDTGRAIEFIDNNVPKFDIAIFLHWNRTTVHKKGLEICRKNDIIHRSCFYKGFISLKEVIFDILINNASIKSKV